MKTEIMEGEECRVRVFELSSSNGWMFSINGRDHQPNWDIGETYENQIGYDTKDEALEAGRREVETRKAWSRMFRADGDWPSEP